MSDLERAFQEIVDTAVDTAIQKYSEKIEKAAREREKHLRVSDIANQLQVGKQTVFNWMYSGRLAYEKFGPQEFRINPSDLNEFLQKHYYPVRIKDKKLVKIK